MNRRLYRSYDDRVLAGVAGGMAETYDLDPAVVRVGWVILALLTGGVILIVYIVMALVVPLSPDDQPAAAWAGAQWPSSTASQQPPPAAGGYGQPVTPSDEQTTVGEAPGAVPPRPFISEREARRQRRQETRSERGSGSDLGGALVIGLILIAIGAYFLLRDFLPQVAWGQLWPVALIVVGALLLLGAFRRRGEP
jgi:phage shock protein C